MNKFWKGVLINIAIIYGITAVIAISYREGVIFMLAPVVLAGLEVLLALVLLISRESRPSAQIMLAACGIVLLVGAAVCTGGLVNV